MSEQDTRRWLKPDSPVDARLAALLEAGRAERPSEAQLQALAKRLGPTFGGPGPSGGGAAAPGTPLFALAIAAAAVVALCGLWALRAERGADADARSVPRAPSAAPTRAALDAGPSTAALQQAPMHDAGARQVTEPHDAPPQASSRAPTRDSRDELVLLEQAHRALGAAPKRALEATVLHAKRFPNSQFAQERELLAIDALRRLSDRPHARARAERFLVQYPGSSHARRVRELLTWATTPLSDRDAGAP
jgi:hypothetical protein